MKHFFIQNGIRCTIQDALDGWIGCVYVECFWCENDGFEELLKSLGLEYVRSDYEMRVYKTQGDRPKQKVKKNLKEATEIIKEYMQKIREQI